LKASEVSISMDGRGRAFDNIFTERLWRSVKYEDVYLKDYETVDAARAGLGEHFRFYNTARPHQALGYRTPAEVHFGVESGECNNVTGINKKEKDAKRKKMLLLHTPTLKN
ncbi:MAG: integrase core domain-containing protein, partial [Phycisphaerales bacterium]